MDTLEDTARGEATCRGEFTHKKTLANFKRSLEVGDNLLLIKLEQANYTSNGNVTPLVPCRIPEHMNKLRVIHVKNTTGFYLKSINDSGLGTFFPWPTAKQLTFQDNKFTITEFTHKNAIEQRRTYQIFK